MYLLPKNKSGFTLVEIMLAMTVFAIIMTSVLLAVENMSIARIKTENRVKLLEELYFFSEQLINNVKEWGTVDYEEYWNRRAYGDLVITWSITWNNIGWSYSGATGVGNYGSGGVLWGTNYGNGLYYCISNGGPRMGTGWCLWSNNNLGTQSGTNINVGYTWTYQRYGQYALQFIDYNSNIDIDWGDEDGNGSILGDEDDKDLWNWPIVLSGSTPELYLINPVDKTRMYFRYVVRQDSWTSTGCILYTTGANDGCMGNVQILKMRGVDYGYTHTGSATDGSAFDGKVDTWLLHNNWPGGVTIPSLERLATGSGNEWVDLFPNSINVKNLQFHVYPQKDPWFSWDARDCNGSSPPDCISPFIHPYVRIQMTVWFAWGTRRTLKNDDPTISVNTTVTLGDRE
jgi:prepilin-type N-terminal cleavage/methylation domain-containing protein